MNWYKLAQIEFDDEPPEWNFPEAEHDYDPNWDYDIDPAPDQYLVQISEEAMNEINTKIIPQIGIGVCKAAYIRMRYKRIEGKRLAMYITGTQPNPVFVVYLENIRDIAKECANEFGCDPNEEIRIGIRTTLFHELAHGIQEWMNLYPDENEAEEFAWRYQENKELWKFWEEL